MDYIYEPPEGKTKPSYLSQWAWDKACDFQIDADFTWDGCAWDDSKTVEYECRVALATEFEQCWTAGRIAGETPFSLDELGSLLAALEDTIMERRQILRKWVYSKSPNINAAVAKNFYEPTALLFNKTLELYWAQGGPTRDWETKAQLYDEIPEEQKP